MLRIIIKIADCHIMHLVTQLLCLCSITLFLFRAPVCAENLQYGPYLQKTTTTSVTVRWYTDQAAKSRVRYRSNGTWRLKRSNRNTTAHSISLADLLPNTRYRYQISSGSRLLARSQFRTAPTKSEATTIKVAVIGDSGSGDSNQIAVSQVLNEFAPRLVLHTGDIVYDSGAFEDYDNRFFQPYGDWLRHIPIFPCIGNHDALNQDVWKSIYSTPARDSSSGDETYYSFDFGKAHFIALNTNADFSVGSDQYRWLVRDLKRSSLSGTTWSILFFHHPPFSDGLHLDDQNVQTGLVPLFERYRVDLVLSGHDHAYERTDPINLSGQGGNVSYVVTGGGGKAVYQRVRTSSRISVYESRFHFVALQIGANKIRVRAIASDGIILDSFGIQK